MINSLLALFDEVLAAIPLRHQHARCLRLIEEALRRERSFIDRHFTDYPQALFQALWNNCSWNPLLNSDQQYMTYRELNQIALQWRSDRIQRSWMRLLRPPRPWLGTGLKRVINGHEKEIVAVVFLGDAGTILSVCEDGIACLWDYASGSLLHRTCVEGTKLRDCRASSCEEFVLITFFDSHTAVVLETATLSKVASHTFPDPPYADWLHSAPVVLIGAGALLFKWSPLDGSLLELQYTTHETIDISSVWFHSINVSPDDSVFVSSYKHDIFLWTLAPPRCVQRTHAHQSSVGSVQFSPVSMNVLSSGYNEDIVKVWSVSDGLVCELALHTPDKSGGVSYSTSGALGITFGSYKDKVVRLWDLNSGAAVRQIPCDIRCTAAHTIGDSQVICGGVDGLLRVWELNEGLSFPDSGYNDEIVACFSCSPDGRVVAASSYDYIVRVVCAETGTVIQALARTDELTTVLGFSPDSKLLLTSDGAATRVYHVATGSLVYSSPLNPADTSDWNPNVWHSSGDVVLLVDRDGVVLANCRSGDQSLILASEASFATGSAAFSPCGEVIAVVCTDRKVRIVEVSTKSVVGMFDVSANGPAGCKWSKSGTMLAVYGYDGGPIVAWRVESCERSGVFALDEHVRQVEWSFDDGALLVLTWNSVRIFDVRSQQCVDAVNTNACDLAAFSSARPRIPFSVPDEVLLWDRQLSGVVARLPRESQKDCWPIIDTCGASERWVDVPGWPGTELRLFQYEK